MEYKMVSCPFNPQHKVSFKRLQYHIIKCEKQNPGFDVCPYNATHRLRPEDMFNHIQECPSARLTSAVFVEEKPMYRILHRSQNIQCVYEDGILWD